MRYLVLIIFLFIQPADTVRTDTTHADTVAVQHAQNIQMDMDSIKIHIKEMIKQLKFDTIK